MTYLETASTSPRGLRASRSPAACASRLLSTIKSEARLDLSSPIWASRTSKTSPDRSALMPWSGMGVALRQEAAAPQEAQRHACLSWFCRSRTSAATPSKYFVDGVTESLTTDLSRINGTFVIGRHTAFTFKGRRSRSGERSSSRAGRRRMDRKSAAKGLPEPSR